MATVTGAGPAILFVCHANLCRSPLAEAYFCALLRARSDLSGSTSVASAGTHAVSGQPPHPTSVLVAGERGLELEGRSRPLHISDLGQFDLILVMDTHNMRDIRARVPGLQAPGQVGLRARVELLGNYDPQAKVRDITDPVCGGVEDFRSCLAQIERACDALFAATFGRD